MKKETKKITLGLIFNWIFGVIFLLVGITTIPESPIGGLAIMLLSTMILPYSNKKISKKLNFQISGGIKFVLVIIIFIIMAVAMPSSGDSYSDTNTQSENNKITATPEETKTYSYSVGDSIQAGDFEWKITKFTTTKTIGSNPYLTTEASGIYLILEVEVENIGKSAKYLTDSYLKLIDDKNREFSPDSSVAFYLDSNQALLFEQVNPGIIKKGKIVFDVPENLDVINLRISSSLLSSTVYNVKLVI
ncbi:DUF4352 domain-containing protein [Candidatus Pacearchaeota archaeon]|nr:DUF4352 domain-containing protein [Candidatus Pacearchaeota archaeon]